MGDQVYGRRAAVAIGGAAVLAAVARRPAEAEDRRPPTEAPVLESVRPYQRHDGTDEGQWIAIGYRAYLWLDYERGYITWLAQYQEDGSLRQWLVESELLDVGEDGGQITIPLGPAE